MKKIIRLEDVTGTVVARLLAPSKYCFDNRIVDEIKLNSRNFVYEVFSAGERIGAFKFERYSAIYERPVAVDEQEEQEKELVIVHRDSKNTVEEPKQSNNSKVIPKDDKVNTFNSGAMKTNISALFFDCEVISVGSNNTFHTEIFGKGKIVEVQYVPNDNPLYRVILDSGVSYSFWMKTCDPVF